MFLSSFNVNLTLGQVHRPWDFGDIVGSLIEKDRHSEKGIKKYKYRIVVVTVPDSNFRIPNTECTNIARREGGWKLSGAVKPIVRGLAGRER